MSENRFESVDDPLERLLLGDERRSKAALAGSSCRALSDADHGKIAERVDGEPLVRNPRYETFDGRRAGEDHCIDLAAGQVHGQADAAVSGESPVCGHGTDRRRLSQIRALARSGRRDSRLRQEYRAPRLDRDYSARSDAW